MSSTNHLAMRSMAIEAERRESISLKIYGVFMQYSHRVPILLYELSYGPDVSISRMDSRGLAQVSLPIS